MHSDFPKQMLLVLLVRLGVRVEAIDRRQLSHRPHNPWYVATFLRQVVENACPIGVFRPCFLSEAPGSVERMFESTVLVDPAAVYGPYAAALDAVPTRPVRGGTAVEASVRVRAAIMLARQAEALALAEIAAFDAQGFAPACGARSTGAFLAAHTHLDPATTSRMVLAARTADRLPQLGQLLTRGQIGVEHIAAVGYATRRLPQEIVTAEDATFAELAASARPSQLRVAGLHLQSLYDSDAVTKNAQHLRDSRYLSLSQTFQDAWHLDGMLTPEDGAALSVALESLMTKGGVEDTRTVTQRRADALVELVELGLRSGELPDCGGDRPRVTLLVQASRNPFHHDDHTGDESGADCGQLHDGLHDLAGAATGTGVGSRVSRLDNADLATTTIWGPSRLLVRSCCRSPGSTTTTPSCSPLPGSSRPAPWPGSAAKPTSTSPPSTKPASCSTSAGPPATPTSINAGR